MEDQFARTKLLFGEDEIEQLKKARVAIFGIGGVGGHALEALVRSGIGTIDVIDNDKVCISNLNRQLLATHKTVGQYKVDAAQQRMKEINPNVVINKYPVFYLPETAGQFNFALYDYVIDAIDTVTGKIELAVQADKAGVPIISSMGAGNKVDPTAFEVADIYQTSVCPLAKVMRRELKKRGIQKLRVVYSREPALTPMSDIKIGEDKTDGDEAEGMRTKRRQIPGSNAFVPSVAGLIIAGEVIKDLTQFHK